MLKRKDILFIFYVTAVPLAILAVFPFSAIGFSPAEKAEEYAGSCAFVRLTREQENAAIESSRSAWRGSGSSLSGLTVNLYSIGIPEMESSQVSRMEDRTGLPLPHAEEYSAFAMPSSLAAAPARVIKPKADGNPIDGQPFSRNDLLKMIQLKKEIQL